MTNQHFEHSRPPCVRGGRIETRRVGIQDRDDLAADTHRQGHRMPLPRVARKRRQPRLTICVRGTGDRNTTLEDSGSACAETGQPPSRKPPTFDEKDRRAIDFMPRALHETLENIGKAVRFIQVADRIRKTSRA